MNVGSLFSGIGGIDLGLERAGMHIAWQCEVDPWCQRVLAKHWPDVPRYHDVRLMPADDIAPVDVIAAGFPCQPVSLAGYGRAQSDERWLWPEVARLVRLLRPRFALLENVPGLLVRGMGDVLGDLAASGYDAEWDCIPASAVGAPHRRDRVWILAYADQERRCRRGADERPEGADEALQSSGCSPARQRVDQDADSSSVLARRIRWGVSEADRSEWWAVEPDVGRVAHGVPDRLDRLAGLGNSVVPQVVECIGRRMMEAA